MSRALDLYELIRRLAPSQPGHRLVRRWRARGREVAAPPVRWVGVDPLPPAARRPRRAPFDRPEGEGWTCAGARARVDAAGALVFDGPDVSELQRHHAGYGEMVRAAAEDGDLASARRWLGAIAQERHPYVRSRRVLALIEARARGLVEAEPVIARDAAAIASQLERDVRGNHLLANAVALVRAGQAFAGPAAASWARSGASLATACVRAQVLADGIHDERCPAYQGLVLEHLLVALETAASVGVAPPPGVEDAARRLAVALEELVLPDGELARRGDGAPGLALPVDSLLAWARARAGPLPAARRGSRAFTAGGFAVLEDVTGRSAVTLFAGPPGPRGLPAHAHADALATEIVLRGTRVVAAAGTAAYGEGPARDADRLPGAFAGVRLDGRACAKPFGAFRMGRRGWVRRLARWEENDVVSFEACSDGLGRPSDPCIHRRLVALCPDVAVVIDEWTGRRTSLVELAWPLAPGLVPSIDAHGVVVDGPSGSFRWFATAGETVLDRGSFATALGASVERSVIWNRVRVARPARVVHVLATGNAPVAVSVVPAPGGALRVELDREGACTRFHVEAGHRP